ncbi:MAG: hypothetical protein N2203_00250 [Bacteroidia bacterium]|nr:hypothetical protein [Bacteroidia bacterium]
MEQVYNKQEFLSQKNKDVLENLIEQLLPKCNGIANRYCKTNEQSAELSVKCFLSVLKEMLNRKEDDFEEKTFLKHFIICLVQTLITQRTGTLVADTTIVSVLKNSSNNLFSNSEYYKTLSVGEIITHIRKLNFIQQIVFNLIVLDNFSLSETAQILQHNELSIKALLEKTKYNLYTSVKSTI